MLIRLALLSAFVMTWSMPEVWAQKYPQSTVKIIVPTSPGGAVDAFGRAIARRLEHAFGNTFIVENRAGANGVIGADVVAKSPPDGSTLVVVFPSHVINPLFFKNVPYDPMGDFEPVIRIGEIPLILVTHPNLPVRSVKELIELAHAKPGSLSFASGGVGSGGHLSGELFKSLTKTDIQHVVYKGNSLALNDVIGGHVSMMFDTISTGLQHVQAGELKLLAVTSANRTPLTPDTPTMIEAGLPGFVTSAWYGLLAPAHTPAPIINMLNAELNAAFKDAAFRAQFTALGVEFAGGSPDDFKSFLRTEADRWRKVITATGMKPQ